MSEPMVRASKLEALCEVWEQRVRDAGLPHPGLAEVRALISGAREEPYDGISGSVVCPVCRSQLHIKHFDEESIHITGHPASAGTGGPGLRATIRQIVFDVAYHNRHVESATDDIIAALAREGEKK